MSAPRAIQFDQAFLAEFEIVSELSAGGFGVVHIARQRSLDRRVAVKFPLVDDAELLGRFEDEARMLASLDHPSIVQVYAWGQTGGHPYLVEELIEGLSLRELLGRRGRLAVAEALPIARDLADALAYVHTKGLIHRDLKPSNILMSQSGAKLIDFGIARDCGRDSRTQFGVILGTPEYIAPELLQGDPAGPPADVYSLGAVLFEMLTGSLVIHAADVPTLLARRLKEDAPSLSSTGVRVDSRLEDLVARMLEREPARRPSLRRAVLPALEELQHGDSGAGLPAPAQDPLDATALASGGSASGVRPQARRAALTSVSRIRTASPPSSSHRPTASVRLQPAPARWPRLLGLGLAALGLAATAALMLHGPAPPPPQVVPPPTSVVRSAAPAPPSPGQAEAERLLAQAERPGPAETRLAAFYGACGRVSETGPSGAKLPPGRLEGLRDSLLPPGAAGGEAAASLLKLLETRNALPPGAETIASKDLVSRYPGAVVEELGTRLGELQLHSRGMELSRASRDRKNVVGRKELEATARQFGSTPGGRLWRALASHVPSLLARPELPLGPRLALARVLVRTRGLELLYRRLGLPPMIEPEASLSKVMTFTSVPMPEPPRPGSPAAELTALAGAAGAASDLYVGKPGEEAFVHKDAETWFFGALGRGDQLPNYKDSLTLRPVVLPARSGDRPAGSYTFVAWVGDLDPEDGFMLRFLLPGGQDFGLNVPLWRPDVRGTTSGHLLCVVRVSTALLPAGSYEIRLEPWRWVMQRQIFAGQEGMISKLMRLTLAVQ